HQIQFPYVAAKWWFADVAGRVPVRTGVRVSGLLGGQRLEGVELTDSGSGRTEVLACDTVVFTGDWIPEHEAARAGGLTLDPGTRGPRAGAGFHTTRRGVFAAGNLLHGAETADICALEGARAGRHIGQFLRDDRWPAAGCPVEAEPPLAWIFPNVVTGAEAGEGLLFRVRTFCPSARVTVRQGGAELFAQTFSGLTPNNSTRLEGGWRRAVDPAGEPVRVALTPA
ncbi:MAG: hypothetical protein JNK29_12440, partial [Anaerolineales bacterium]|nr:hypothetical protein [Anaerolineales bacterium]